MKSEVSSPFIFSTPFRGPHNIQDHFSYTGLGILKVIAGAMGQAGSNNILAGGHPLLSSEEASDPIEDHVGGPDRVHDRLGGKDVPVGRLRVEVVGHLDLWHGHMIRVLTIRCLTI